MKSFQRSTMVVFAVLCCIAATGQLYAVTADEIDAQALIKSAETQYQGETSHSIMSMEIKTEGWERTMKLEAWSKGRDMFLTKVLAPEKDKGVATLKIGDEIRNYIPEIDHLQKIPQSLMGDNWMGSHLTNDDLVKENKVDQLYTFNVKEVSGDTVKIHCTPKPDAAVVWGGIDYSIDYSKTVPILVEYFDEDGELVRTISFSDYEQRGGRWVPLVMVVQPIDAPDEHTKLIYETLEYGVGLNDSFFSIQTIRRR